jgi:iron complex outermembrane receptor protein
MNNYRQCPEHVSINSGSPAWVIAAALLCGSPVYAQSSSPPVPSNPVSASDSLQEIVVTAERRAENLQQVPISVVARSGADLNREGVYNGADLQNIVPSLSIQPSTTGATFVNIRGVGLQQTNPASSNGVAWYLDGVYDPSYASEVDTFYDVQDVEVLRGPQGTLVGSNADGGAIFINSVQPSFDQLKGYALQQFGSYSDFRTEGAINLPISSMFAARIAFVRETQNSFTNNAGPQPPSSVIPGANNQPGNTDYSAARILLTFKPSDSFSATLRYETYSSSNDGPALKPDMANFTKALNPAFNPAAYDPYAASIQNEPYTIDYDTVQYFNLSGNRAALNAVWNITAGLELKSVTGYITGEERDYDDVDASSAPSDQTLTRKGSWRTFTQEFDLLSTSDSPLQWVVGAYYLSSSDPLALTFLNPTNPFPMNQTSLSLVSQHTNEAAFGSATYRFSPEWSATLGVRYSHDKLPFDETLCTGFAQTCGNFSTTDNKTTGTGKLNWQITPDTMVYASVASGYKAGGVNLQLAIPAIGFAFNPPPFQPETNVVEELGVKTTVLDNHLRINADVYDSQYKNYQIQQFLGGLPYTQGPGKAKIYGAEAEVAGVFDALRFDLGASYMHATVGQDFSYVQSFGPPLTVTSGTQMPYAPESMFNAGIQYSFKTGNGSLTPRLQYQYVAPQYIIITHDILPQPDTQLQSHSTADFRLTYAAPEHWAVQAYVTNLTNKVYVAAISLPPQPSANDLLYGAPRQYGARLSYTF